jgi:hypothetical protein
MYTIGIADRIGFSLRAYTADVNLCVAGGIANSD